MQNNILEQLTLSSRQAHRIFSYKTRNLVNFKYSTVHWIIADWKTLANLIKSNKNTVYMYIYLLSQSWFQTLLFELPDQITQISIYKLMIFEESQNSACLQNQSAFQFFSWSAFSAISRWFQKWIGIRQSRTVLGGI